VEAAGRSGEISMSQFRVYFIGSYRAQTTTNQISSEPIINGRVEAAEGYHGIETAVVLSPQLSKNVVDKPFQLAVRIEERSHCRGIETATVLRLYYERVNFERCNRRKGGSGGRMEAAEVSQY
jgi:hypothetical protein